MSMPDHDSVHYRFSVCCGPVEVATYYRFGWGPWGDFASVGVDGMPRPARLPADCSIEAVVRDIVDHYWDDFPEGYVGPDVAHKNFGRKDLAIWQAGYLAAIVQPIDEDEVRATILSKIPFDGTDDDGLPEEIDHELALTGRDDALTVSDIFGSETDEENDSLERLAGPELELDLSVIDDRMPRTGSPAEGEIPIYHGFVDIGRIDGVTRRPASGDIYSFAPIRTASLEATGRARVIGSKHEGRTIVIAPPGTVWLHVDGAMIVFNGEHFSAKSAFEAARIKRAGFRISAAV